MQHVIIRTKAMESFVQTFYFIDRQKTYTRTKGVAKAVNQI